jgi:purine nucleosidase
LFRLVHHLLSPSVDIRAVIGSHLNARDGFDNSKKQADNAAKQALEIIRLVKPTAIVPVIAGSNTAMMNDSTPVKSEAVRFIIKEAMRTDVKSPLYVVCGAGLTEIASAVLMQPEIEKKIILIWIGGAEYPDLAFPPPNYSSPEYNLNIDMNAAKVIFNKSSITFWQVPRNTYRQCLLSYAQLLLNIKSKGEVGRFLAAKIEGVMSLVSKYGLNLGETYVLGDSPLVLLTALQSSFEADLSSSRYVMKMAPKINDGGDYEFNDKGRNIRVYDWLDTNLMFNDFFAKLSLFSK